MFSAISTLVGFHIHIAFLAISAYPHFHIHIAFFSHESSHEGHPRFPKDNVDGDGGPPLSYRWVSADRSSELSRSILLHPKNFP